MKMLSEVANRLNGQKMFQILEKTKKLESEGKNIYHFEIGDPDFDTPNNIVDAAMKSLMDGDTHYTKSSGIDELKEIAQEVTLRSRGFKPDTNQLLVTAGANIQLYYAIVCTVNPGDDVIIPDPSFVSYQSILKFVGANIIKVPLREENNFQLTQWDIAKAITPKTRMIIINSPSNPTGAVMSPYEISEIYNLAKKHDAYLLSDEIYARMVYDVRHHSPSLHDECKERVILVNGFSKSYAMTGWRLGVCTGPKDVIEKMGLMLETTSSCVSPFIQKAGIEALTGSQIPILGMVSELKNRRDVIVEGLNSMNKISCINPDGAFYVFPNIIKTGMTSDEFTDYLLYEAGIAVCSGTAFGKNGEGHIRMSYANNSIDHIEAALDSMRSLL